MNTSFVNFWNNGRGICIAEMPELEELCQELKSRNVNLIGAGADFGEREEQLAFVQNGLKEKGVAYANISPDPDKEFYKDFVSEIFTYPTTYIVDSQGNIVGVPHLRQREGADGHSGGIALEGSPWMGKPLIDPTPPWNINTPEACGFARLRGAFHCGEGCSGVSITNSSCPAAPHAASYRSITTTACPSWFR